MAREKFQFQKYDETDMRDMRDSSGSRFRSVFKQIEGLSAFKVGSQNLVRILPPTWPSARKFALELWQHFQVGPDNQRYLCPEQMFNVFNQIGMELPVEPRCAPCDSLRDAQSDGDGALADDLKPKRSWALFLIDRNTTDKDNIYFWAMPYTVNKDLAQAILSDQEAGILQVHDPYDGYDLDFSTEGKGIKTNYGRVNIGRRPTPLHSDDAIMNKWLDFITAHPLPTMLQFYPYDEVARLLCGKPSAEDEPGDAPSGRGGLPPDPDKKDDDLPAAWDASGQPVEEQAGTGKDDDLNREAFESAKQMSRGDLNAYIVKHALTLEDPDELGKKQLVDLVTAHVVSTFTPQPNAETVTEPALESKKPNETPQADEGEGRDHFEQLRNRYRQPSE